MSLPKEVLDAVDLADTDTLVRSIDGFCASRSWDDLLTLRLHCQAAVERGKQLWAVDEHVRYRLALEGPADLGEVRAASGAKKALSPKAPPDGRSVPSPRSSPNTTRGSIWIRTSPSGLSGCSSLTNGRFEATPSTR